MKFEAMRKEDTPTSLHERTAAQRIFGSAGMKPVVLLSAPYMIQSLTRGPADQVVALALIHHLVISNNVPMDHLASFLAQLGRWLIIEFVPKDDPQVQKLLAWRKDIFEEYTQSAFEQAFRRLFAIRAASVLPETGRCLYLVERIPST